MTRRTVPACLVLALVALAVLVAACGGPGPSGAASPSGVAASPASPGAGSPRPRPTGWPGPVVLAIEALGVADTEIRKAINDLSTGIQTEDLALIRRAADGLAGIDILTENVERIERYEPMQPMAAQFRTAIPQIDGAAEELRAAIDAGDGAAITAATQRLTEGLTAYVDLQPVLADWVNQSIEMRRLLVN